AVRGEGNGPAALMPRQDAPLPAGVQVPDAGSHIPVEVRRRQQGLAIGRQGDGVDRGEGPVRTRKPLPRGGVPEPDRVSAGLRQGLAVGRQRQLARPAERRVQDTDLLAGRCLPNEAFLLPNEAVFPPAVGEHALAVVRESEWSDRVLLALETANLLARSGV